MAGEEELRAGIPTVLQGEIFEYTLTSKDILAHLFISYDILRYPCILVYIWIYPDIFGYQSISRYIGLYHSI
jgi:hypothetical protein